MRQCPSRSRLARLALGFEAEDDPAIEAHVESCPGCEGVLCVLRNVAAALSAAHTELPSEESGHVAAREALLRRLPAPPPPLARSRPLRKLFVPFLESIGDPTMRRRFLIGSAGVAAALTLGLAWLATGGVSAASPRLGEVTSAIRKARSFEFTMTATPGAQVRTLDGLPRTSRYEWEAPGSYRIEIRGGAGGSAVDLVEVHPFGRTGVKVDHVRKIYTRLPACVRPPFAILPIPSIEDLASYSGEADRDLGRKEIDGWPAFGFVIGSRKLDPDAAPFNVEVWADAKTRLPILIRMGIDEPKAPGEIRLDRFRWNAAPARGRFDAAPPEGYAGMTPPPDSLDVQVAKMTDALRLYADLKGSYPRVTTIYGDEMAHEVRELARPANPDDRDGVGRRLDLEQRAYVGFNHINIIQQENPDTAYHGASVGPADKDRVLFRWKLEDGRYEVLFGDLRAEAVSAERLGAIGAGTR